VQTVRISEAKLQGGAKVKGQRSHPKKAIKTSDGKENRRRGQFLGWKKHPVGVTNGRIKKNGGRADGSVAERDATQAMNQDFI